MMTLYELRKSREIDIGHDIPGRVVARASGMSANKFWRAERGQYIPNALETRNLAKFYKVSLESITAIIDETIKQRTLRENPPQPEQEGLPNEQPAATRQAASA